MADSSAAMIGSLYSPVSGYYSDKHWNFIKTRPWFQNRERRSPRQCLFATGSWWMTRTHLLKDYNWPDPDLVHNGGDVLLGELMYQNRLILRNYSHGLWINADESGRPSKASRRGFSQRSLGT